MKRRQVIIRSLWFYWRTNLGVCLGAAVGAAVLVGALAVGDSVKHSLKMMALARLGEAHLAMASGDRFFRAALAQELGAELSADAAAVLQVGGLAVRPDGSARANSVQVLGVDQTFWSFARHKSAVAELEPGQVIVSTSLAKQLSAGVGDVILLRVETPGTLPHDMPLANSDDGSLALRVQVAAVVDDDFLGRFSLRAGQIPPFNAFVHRPWLAKRLELSKRANLLLIGDGPTVGAASEALRRVWQLADAELQLRKVSLEGRDPQFELRSRRVFIDSHVGQKIGRASTQRVLAYFVNRISAGQRATPYSTVAAMDGVDLDDDEIIINRWLADDLAARQGDAIELTYFVVGPDRQLVEQSSTFRLHKVVPIKGFAADRELMPAFPGLAEAEHCRDWEPGIPIELEQIREKDERYWEKYRGTPKAFVSLAAGQKLWANRFGDLTAIRFAESSDGRAQVAGHIRAALQASDFGLIFDDVRASAIRAARQGQPFGVIFVSLSFILLAAAVLLTGLLFIFGVEQRLPQVGMLLAMGWPRAAVRGALVFEGVIVAIGGTVLGCVGGLVYARGVLAALASVWRGAVAESAIAFHVQPLMLPIGAAVNVLVAVLAMHWTLRHAMRRTARELLTSLATTTWQTARSPWPYVVAAASLVAAIALGLTVHPQSTQSAAGLFLGVGALVLAACLSFCRAVLAGRKAEAQQALTFASLGWRNVTRRRGRSLATVAMLACGVFIVIAVGVYRIGPQRQVHERSSGTGGFSLYGQTALPVRGDLNDPEGQAFYGLDNAELDGVSFVPMRVRGGDEASCLNLNRPQVPRLVGVTPQMLQSRGAFSFSKVLLDTPLDSKWDSLATSPDDGGPIPAVADEQTAMWALGKKLGDTIAYTDEFGRAFEVCLVGLISNSVLQGSIFINEDDFERLYPSVSGYRTFLIDAPPGGSDELIATLTRSMQDVGLELTGTADRLAAFNAVQNTYISIFQALGGLGLVLASAGLGMVVLRNMLERRSELALLSAVGFSRSRQRRLVFTEHTLLLFLGLIAGMVAAIVAVVPSLRSADRGAAVWPTTFTAVAVGVSGLVWVYAAVQAVMRRRMLDALRNE